MIQHFFEWADGIATTFHITLKPLLVLISVVTIFCASWIFKRTHSHFPLPPGPRGLPVLGYLPFIGTDLHVTFAKLADHYGPLYKLWLGNKLCIVVSSPAMVKEIVRDKDTIFGNRSATIAGSIATYDGSDIALADYGPAWQKMRKILAKEILSKASIDACFEKRRDGVRMSIKQVYGSIGKPVDVGNILLLTFVDVVARMLWGSSFLGTNQEISTEGSDLKNLFAEFMVIFGSPNLSDFFPALAWLDLQSVAKRMRNVSGCIDRILEEVINERRKSTRSANDSKNGNNDLLQILLELVDNGDSEVSLSKIQMQGLLKDIVIGGTDTNATVTEWAFSELLKHPEMLKLVYEELTQVVGLDTMVEESHLHKLQYLKAVIKETHRLHPTIPLLIPRRPSETTDIGGYTIPKDTKVFINVWAMHRDEKLWDIPLEFRPERFLNCEVEWDYTGNDFRYLPFGSGRRICAGLPIAEKMQMYVLASMLHSFKWEVASSEEIDLSDTFGIVLKKALPLIAVPSPRLSNLELYA